MSAKILVVDDEWDFTELLSFNLTVHGFKVMTASNGLDAFVVARRFLPEIMVLDLMMEGMDGYTVCEVLRRQPWAKASSIIVVTAAGGEMARMNALAAGADEFLTKPFSTHELVRRVRQLLERREARRTRKMACVP